MERHVLFLAPEASATGAPMVLLHLLCWLKRHTDWSFELLLGDGGGQLLPQFAALTRVRVHRGPYRSGKTSVTRVLYRAGMRGTSEWLRLRNLRRLLGGQKIDLVYSNTLVNGDMLEYLSDLGCPVLTHVHELEWCIRQYVGLPVFHKVREHTDHYLAVSQAVCDNLVRNHGIPPQKIDLVHEFVPGNAAHAAGLPHERRRVRAQLGIRSDALVVCGSGTLGWRKGTDLFVQLARLVSERLSGRAVHFVWVGGESAGPEFECLRHDADRAGVAACVHLLGHVDDPLSYYAAGDVFALVSREDPYPLVMLEASSVGKPIVCFDGAGGAPEFVEDDAGRVVPYLDMPALATATVSLLEDAELRTRLGRRAAQKVTDAHGVDHMAPRIVAIMEQLISPAAREIVPAGVC